jgi:hypothetical protein
MRACVLLTYGKAQGFTENVNSAGEATVIVTSVCAVLVGRKVAQLQCFSHLRARIPIVCVRPCVHQTDVVLPYVSMHVCVCVFECARASP